MTTQRLESVMRRRTIGDIAATLLGATAAFRKFKIDFCYNGDLELAAA